MRSCKKPFKSPSFLFGWSSLDYVSLFTDKLVTAEESSTIFVTVHDSKTSQSSIVLIQGHPVVYNRSGSSKGHLYFTDSQWCPTICIVRFNVWRSVVDGLVSKNPTTSWRLFFVLFCQNTNTHEISSVHKRLDERP